MKRFKPVLGSMIESKDGEYVLFEDHRQEEISYKKGLYYLEKIIEEERSEKNNNDWIKSCFELNKRNDELGWLCLLLSVFCLVLGIIILGCLVS